MPTFTLTLKLLAPVFLIAGGLHVLLGLNADVLLGAAVPESVIRDPVLDSQNRFYGAAFMLYGVLLWLCATDIPRYASVLRCMLALFFAGGLARLLSVALYGWPSPLVIGLLISELAGPAIIAWWLTRLESQRISE